MNLRQTVLLVALLNLAYFGVEFAVALAIGSVSLFADSVDFLEDASINLLIAVGLGWSAQNRARLGMVLAGVILVPVAATLWTAWQKFSLAVMMVPSRLNSMTAWARPMACSWLRESAAAIFCAVTSEAILTTLYGLPFRSKIGL